jgi:hypothetical protein
MRIRSAVAPFRIAFACVLAGLSGCVMATTNASYTRNTPTASSSRAAVSPAATSLGENKVGATTRRLAALTIANAVLTSSGWRVAATHEERAELRTEWMYLRGAEYTPNSTTTCDPGTQVGVRMLFHPIGAHGDTTLFFLHAETRVPRAIDTQQGERLARDAFNAMSESMTAGLRVAGDIADVFGGSVAPASLAANVGPRGAWQVCGTIRQHSE